MRRCLRGVGHQGQGRVTEGVIHTHTHHGDLGHWWKGHKAVPPPLCPPPSSSSTLSFLLSLISVFVFLCCILFFRFHRQSIFLFLQCRDCWLANALFFQILKDIPRMTSLAHLFQQKPVQEVSITLACWL